MTINDRSDIRRSCTNLRQSTTADNQLTPAAPASQLVGRFAVSLWRRASPKRSRRLPPSTAVYLREPLEQTLCVYVFPLCFQSCLPMNWEAIPSASSLPPKDETAVLVHKHKHHCRIRGGGDPAMHLPQAQEGCIMSFGHLPKSSQEFIFRK